MDESERSRLVYLLDAVQAAPKKSKQLIAVVSREKASDAFRSAIESLRSATNVEATSRDLRNKLI